MRDGVAALEPRVSKPRWVRLVGVGQGSRRPLVTALGFAVLTLVLLVAAPGGLGHVDETRRLAGAESWRAIVVVQGAGLLALLVVTVWTVLVGVGALGVLYGRAASGSRPALLASPAGVLGLPSRRRALTPGEVSVHIVELPVQGSADAYGQAIVNVSVRRGGRERRVARLVHLDEGSRRRLCAWLTAQGFAPVYTSSV